MAITDIFSKRQKRLRGEMPDVYVYDELPKILKIQILYIWKDIKNVYSKIYINPQSYDNITIYQKAASILRREYGLFNLFDNTENCELEFQNFFLNEQKIEKCLDAIEVFCNLAQPAEIFNDLIKELNDRFKEHGIGYQYENGQIIRIDSQFIHAEVVQPALQLLNNRHYAGAQQEFLKAHEHYRNGNAKEALNECLKSFESVMKVICKKRQWSYSGSATSKDLIHICLNHELIPDFWKKHYSSLSNLLKSSIPPARNTMSAHGQGSDVKSVPDYLVAYMLHMTASAIVFLIEAEKNL